MNPVHFLFLSAAATVSALAAPSSWHTYMSEVKPENSLLVRGILTGVDRVVDVWTLRDAIAGIKNGSIVLPDRNLFVDRHDFSLPAAQVLWNGYMRTIEDTATPKDAEKLQRELTMLLLAQGLNASFTFEGGRFRQAGNLAGTPLGYLLREMWDPEFIDAFLDAGHDIGGSIVHMPPPQYWEQDSIVGASQLHFVANSGLEVGGPAELRSAFTLSSLLCGCCCSCVAFHD